MISRPAYLDRLASAVRRAPVTALLGPRQVGKTTLARQFAADRPATRFDLELETDRRRLDNAELVLGALDGLVVIDEIQLQPDLFSLLRVLVDRPESTTRFLVLGSATPDIVRHGAETLAGRVEFVELAGFDLTESGPDAWRSLWLRGGFPRSFLAADEADSLAWREAFVRTFLERDIPQLGITTPASTMRRFWTMLAHFHGQTWNASEIARSLGVTDKTVRGYLDVLTGTFMVRQLQPWYENVARRQVKSPKVYFRDSGLLHTLLDLSDEAALLGHPRAGASWEGFALEQVLALLRPSSPFFWATHQGAELDLLFTHRGQRYGVEIKFSEAPTMTRSMHIALADLRLEHLWVVHPGQHRYPMTEQVTAWPLRELPTLADELTP
jgi:predicted AAA+ superfamily ATPase